MKLLLLFVTLCTSVLSAADAPKKTFPGPQDPGTGTCLAPALEDFVAYVRPLKQQGCARACGVFVTDGHEAPPLDPRHRPAFDDKPGDVAGLLVGVGGLLPVPIPKSDPMGRPLGFWRADEVMQTASLIKLAVMVEAYRQLDAKKVDFTKTLTLTKDDKVPGAGVLTAHFSDGATFPLKDAVRLMIVFSDNTATNMVLDQVGIKSVNDTTKTFGLPETRINAKVFKGSTTSVDPERTKKYSLGSITAN